MTSFVELTKQLGLNKIPSIIYVKNLNIVDWYDAIYINCNADFERYHNFIDKECKLKEFVNNKYPTNSKPFKNREEAKNFLLKYVRIR